MSTIPLPPPLDKATPSDFLVPGIDKSFALTPGQSMELGRIPAAEIGFLSVSSVPDHRLRTYTHFWNNGNWTKNVVFPTLLAVADNVTFDGKYIGVDKKYLLSGAPASRLRNEYASKGPRVGGMSPDEALTQHLREVSFKRRQWPIEFSGEYRNLDFLVQVKNFHNYYHYTREALHYLTLYKKFGLNGKILMCRSDKNNFPFVKQSVEAWFPDIADRVEYLPQTRQPLRFDRVLLPFVPLHYYFQCRDRTMPSITDVGPVVKRSPTRLNIHEMERNSCETSLIEMSKICHETVDAVAKPRRIYVRRKSGRSRNAVNEELFIDRLIPMGFEIVHFEDYTVREQGEIVSQSEVVIGLHGAGLANMVYARPGCHVIELSNLQTIRARYGDFNGFAMASGAKYHHFVLDHDFEDPDDPTRLLPVIAKDGHRGVIFSPFTAEVAASYVHALLYPDQTVALLLRGEMLAKDKEKSELVAFLRQNGDKLAHFADTHVWRANVATDARDRHGVLHHLLNALVLAPKRPLLLKRILNVARELHDDVAFEEALTHMRRYFPDEIEPLFKEKGWPLPEALRPAPEIDAPESEDSDDGENNLHVQV